MQKDVTATNRFLLLIGQVEKELRDEGQREHGLQAELSRRIGITSTWLHHIRGGRGVGSSTIQKVCDHMNLRREWFYEPELKSEDYHDYERRSRVVMEETSRPEVEAFIRKHEREMTMAHARDLREMFGNYTRDVSEQYLHNVWNVIKQKDSPKAQQKQVKTTPRPNRRKLGQEEDPQG